MINANRLRAGMLAPGFILKDSEVRKLALSDFGGEINLPLFFCKTLESPLCLKRPCKLKPSCDFLPRIGRVCQVVPCREPIFEKFVCAFGKFSYFWQIC